MINNLYYSQYRCFNEQIVGKSIDKLGILHNLPFMPIYAFKECETVNNNVIFGINHYVSQVQYVKNILNKSYNDLYNCFKDGENWYNLGIADCENIIVNRGTLIDISDVENPIILISVTLKKEFLNKYFNYDEVNKKYSPIRNVNIDHTDFVTFINHKFVLDDNPVYKKLYRKFLKDIIIPDAYSNGMEVRHVTSINDLFFIEKKFPMFDTINDRISFNGILHNFITGAPKLNLNWQQTETDQQDISGNETSSNLLPQSSTSNPLDEATIVQQLSERVANLIGD